jgi:hypothetical protein
VHELRILRVKNLASYFCRRLLRWKELFSRIDDVGLFAELRPQLFLEKLTRLSHTNPAMLAAPQMNVKFSPKNTEAEPNSGRVQWRYGATELRCD